MSDKNGTVGALAGIKVVDMTRVLGGPYCTQVLADHGAEVLKVEPPQGDEVRDWGPPFHEGDASYFIGVNRNKRSIGLDLTVPEGREVLFRLLDEADVLIENLKTGTMERWGLGYEETLKQRFPSLIHCRISGYGADGPLGGYPGYDAIVQAMAGWFSVNGAPNSGPTRVGLAMVDIGTGLYSAISILMALQERTRSGLGQFIDMTLYDCAVSLMHPHVPNYYLSGKTPGLTGNQHTNVVPYDRFHTKTVDIFVGAGNNRAFLRFCTVLGAPDLAEDDRYKDNGDRLEHREELTEIITGLLAKRDGEEVCEQLLQSGVPAGPVLDTAQVMAAEHTKYRDMAIERGWYKMTGIPIKFSRTPGAVRSVPPRFGEHGREILAQHGFGEKEIAALADQGILVETRRK